MPKDRTPGLVFQPTTHKAMQRGINRLASAIRPTLGPAARTVAIDQLVHPGKLPELLDSGGIVARRIIELADRGEDVGAMLLRALVCRQHDDMGDGTATAAVLFQAVFDASLRYVAAGGNAARLRYHLERALPLILNQLDSMTVFVEGKERLVNIANSICHDPPMADLLGEIFDIIGPYGQIDIRKDQARGLRREYVEGMYWNGGLFSRAMIADAANQRTVYENAALFLSDFEVEEPRDLLPLIEAAVEAKISALVIVIRRLSEKAMSLVVAANRPEKLRVMAVKLPGSNPVDRDGALEDLAVLTGAVPLLRVAGSTLESVRPEHFGRSRRAWADLRNFGIVAGKGNTRALRQHLFHLEEQFNRTADPELRKKIQARIGRLMGGSATLYVGGATKLEIEARKALAERTAETLRGAVREGVLPGGGVALLNCRAALEDYDSADPDERAACQILVKALAEPARVIYANAGYDPSEVMAKLAYAPPGHGFDVITGQIIDMQQAGILDSAPVLKHALRSAVTTAGLALSVDVLVQHRKPETATQPG
ncbi:MAG TPA: chaperonin GroEL [Spirillospora sp.]|nr:chaperonin GroEL [Spirillospora sp.]